MKMHTMKDGGKIAISEMSDNHLENTIAMLERRACNGVTVENGGSCPVFGQWYDRDVLYDEDALGVLGYEFYIDERARRLNE